MLQRPAVTPNDHSHIIKYYAISYYTIPTWTILECNLKSAILHYTSFIRLLFSPPVFVPPEACGGAERPLAYHNILDYDLPYYDISYNMRVLCV